jgi:hypothetical protein
LGRARDHFVTGISLYDDRRHERHKYDYAVDPLIVCLSYLSVAGVLLDGEPAGAEPGRRLGALLKRRFADLSRAHPFSLAFAFYWLACSHQIRGDPRRTVEQAEKAIRVSRDYHFPQWEAMGHVLKGWGVARAGEPADGVEMIRAGIEAHASTGARIFRPYFLLLLAQAQALRAAGLQGVAKSSAQAEARETADKAFGLADSTGEHTWTPAIHQLRGELALLGPTRTRQEAEEFFRRAEEVAAGQGAAVWRLQAQLRRHKLLRRLRRRQEADDLLNGIRGAGLANALRRDRAAAQRLLRGL